MEENIETVESLEERVGLADKYLKSKHLGKDMREHLLKVKKDIKLKIKNKKEKNVS